jgi:hypothetical protein
MNKPETREMYGEIAALVASVAKALELSDADTIAAMERGEIGLDFGADENGNRFVAATHAGRTTKIYAGAIKHAGDAPPKA